MRVRSFLELAIVAIVSRLALEAPGSGRTAGGFGFGAKNLSPSGSLRGEPIHVRIEQTRQKPDLGETRGILTCCYQ